MELNLTTTVIIAAVAVIAIAVGLRARAEMVHSILTGELGRVFAFAKLQSTYLGQMLERFGWNASRYAEATPVAVVNAQALRCATCGHTTECRAALDTGDFATIMSFCPNAASVKSYTDSMAAAPRC